MRLKSAGSPVRARVQAPDSMRTFKNVLAWLKRNERHISTFMYIGGFLSDLVTYVYIPVSLANVLFVSHLVLIAICIVGSYLFVVRGYDSRPGVVWKTLTILFPLGVQFFIGGSLSGYLIFYTKSAFVFVSWPFLLVLLGIFIGNEYFRNFRSYLAFQTSLFFFALYAYAIFGLPLVVHSLGYTVFIESTAASIVLFAAFLCVLGIISWRRLKSALTSIIASAAAIVVIVAGSYTLGFIPPIPLTLVSAQVYYSVSRVPQGYEVQAAPGAECNWWQIGPFCHEVVPYTDGSSLSVLSSVFAPTSFGTDVVHKWEWYNPHAHEWVTKATIQFPIEGGRNGGYRGYSTISGIVPGDYRVSVETVSGQVIGRLYFNAEPAPQAPVMVTEYK